MSEKKIHITFNMKGEASAPTLSMNLDIEASAVKTADDYKHLVIAPAMKMLKPLRRLGIQTFDIASVTADKETKPEDLLAFDTAKAEWETALTKRREAWAKKREAWAKKRSAVKVTVVKESAAPKETVESVTAKLSLMTTAELRDRCRAAGLAVSRRSVSPTTAREHCNWLPKAELVAALANR